MNLNRIMNSLKIGLGALLGVLVYVFLNIDQEHKNLEIGASAILGIFISYAVEWITRKLDKLINWKQNIGLRLLSGIFVLTLLTSFTILFFIRVSGNTISQSLSIKVAILMLSLAILFNIIYFIFYSYYEFTKGQMQQIVLNRKQTTLQLDALKSQLSPHFLFNSMNSLSALVHKDAKQAENFIRSLAHSFEYVLEKYNNPLVTLEKELDFVDSYIKMMKIRFGNHLHLKTEISESTLKTRIPPLTLQMLVENAVKHNLMDKENELTIVIKEANNYVEVSNEKNIRMSVRHSTKVGLQNIAERYELISNKEIKIESNGFFKVYLPLIT